MTLLRWSADWDTASALYEQAAAEYKKAGLKRKTMTALEKASLGQEKLNSCVSHPLPPSPPPSLLPSYCSPVAVGLLCCPSRAKTSGGKRARVRT